MVVNANGSDSNIEFFGANGSSTKIETSTWFTSAAAKPTINILNGGDGSLESPITGFKLSSSNSVTGGLYAIELIVDGKPLIDAVYTGPFNKLYQTWEQYARTALGYTQDQLAVATKKLAEQEPYVQLMRALIRPWQVGSTYNYGDIVQLNGMTYQAEANDVRLIAPDKVEDTGVGTVWRPLVRIAPGRTVSRPEVEQPTVLPTPEEPDIDFAPGTTSGSISTMED